MNNREKEVIQYQMDSEKAVLDELRKQYQRSLNDIDRKIRILQSDELTQSKIYQLQYQQVLKAQVESILDKLHGDEYSTIQQFLSDSYTTGFVGTMYDLHGQDVPLLLPIDKNAAVKAVLTDSKVKEGLYEALGVDVKKLKKSISAEITRGIASGMSYFDIARNISRTAKAPYSRAKTIVRTEAHRIQQASTMDAQRLAKSKGADVVKQWDATLDGDTRPTHRKLDGQIKEVDEPFEANGKKAMFPGDFGDPAEDCNCRCVSLTRARWALDEDELQTLKNRAEFFGLDKSDDFEDFKKKYLKAAEDVSKESNLDKLQSARTLAELEDTVKGMTGKKVDLSGTDLELMKKNMVQISKLSEEYGVHFDAIETTSARKFIGEVNRSGRYGDKVTLLYPKKHYKSRAALLDELKKAASSGNMPRIGSRNVDVYTTTHEFAHTFSSSVISRLYGTAIETDFWDEIEAVYMDYKKNGNGILGKYASSNQDEFLAEAFADAKLGARPSKWSEDVLVIIDRYYKKKRK